RDKVRSKPGLERAQLQLRHNGHKQNAALAAEVPSTGHCARRHLTRKIVLLVSVPLGVVTSTRPVVAPVGIVALISVGDLTVKVAGTPLKVTTVVPVRLVPRIFTLAPTAPTTGTVSTNWRSPRERLNTVPSLLVPSKVVVPYKVPDVACASPA